MYTYTYLYKIIILLVDINIGDFILKSPIAKFTIRQYFVLYDIVFSIQGLTI